MHTSRIEELEKAVRIFFLDRNRHPTTRERLKNMLRELRRLRYESAMRTLRDELRKTRCLEVPIGATVYEVSECHWFTSPRVGPTRLTVWGYLPDGQLLVTPKWSNAWSQIRPIRHWARRLPKTQR